MIRRTNRACMGHPRRGTQILVLVHDLNIRVLNKHGELLRELTLDPTRDYQPLPRT
jgi:hypothetical protein